MAKVLIFLGIILILVGIMLHFKISIPYLGKLPGDISYKGDHFQFYFPIVTCIILSVVLSLIFYIWNKL